MKIGIDSFSFYIPKLFLPITDLAKARNIEPEKLEKGLGLQAMSLLDTNQDVVSMATNAVYRLIIKEKINLKEISRIYVGTESGVDSSKPIASYIISNLEQEFGEKTLSHCDVLDHTFACIGGIDALQSCLDFITLNPSKKAIVVATDVAKYDLESSGEYTQGAGAFALLITSNPSILSLSNHFGVSTAGVFDFFKPRKIIAKKDILNTQENLPWFSVLENEIQIYKEQPVFDGQYSNECYINRIKEAYYHFLEEKKSLQGFENWHIIAMHLPYCFQGRRTFIEIFKQYNKSLLESMTGDTEKEKIKALSKSNEYLQLINEKIKPTELASALVGNCYTGSIFLGLLSALTHHAESKSDLTNKKVGFIAYGSGSKAKVFEGVIEENWLSKINHPSLFDILENRKAIDFDTYEKLHKKELKKPLENYEGEWILETIETQKENLIGARYYKKQ